MEAAPAEAPVQAVGSAKLRQSLLLRAASFEGASSDWRPSLRSGPATGSSQAWQVDADEVAMMGQFSPDDVATVLHQSARNGHLEVFQTVLSKIMDPKSGQILVDTIDADGNNLLHTAAACGAFQVVDWLLGAGGEQEMIYGLNNYKQTPLHVACVNGRKRVTKRLIESRADQNARDCDGRKPLSAATESGQDIVCSLLVGGGVPTDTEQPEAELSFAGLSDMVNCGNLDGFTQALQKQFKETKGPRIDLDAPDPTCCNQTLLHMACYQCHAPMVELLLRSKASVTPTDSIGWTALHFAAGAAEGGSTQLAVAELLLKASASVGQSDSTGSSAAQVAEYAGHTGLSRMLIEHTRATGKAKSIYIGKPQATVASRTSASVIF